MSEKNKKIIFSIMVMISFGMILFLNILTPVMSDDISYGAIVAQATSLGDLFKQEYVQYMNWSGRSVVHFLLRIFLSMDKMVFIVCNSLAFLLLSFLIYWNVEGRKKYDIVLFGLIQVMLYVWGVSFGETILWETGACNYLWGSVIILGFVTWMNHLIQKDLEQMHRGMKGLLAFVLFILGVLGGWCNENTSGGGFLLVIGALLLTGFPVMKKYSVGFCLKNMVSSAIYVLRKKTYLLAGIIGMCIGLALMVLAPGNRIRSSLQEEENFTGLLGLASRALKGTITMKELFTELVVILVFAVVLMVLQRVCWKKIARVGIYTFAALATGYVLILVSVPSDRAYFGMGIILMIACLQAIYSLKDTGDMAFVKWLKYSCCILGILWLATTFLEEGANVARIYREYEERDQFAQMQKEDGEPVLVLPMLRPDFETPYSFGYESDLCEDPSYWINQFYCEYYHVGTVIGMPREEWEETYGARYGIE